LRQSVLEVEPVVGTPRISLTRDFGFDAAIASRVADSLRSPPLSNRFLHFPKLTMIDAHSIRSFVSVAAVALFALSLVACGRAKNTPEEALAALNTALKEQKWDLLYDIMPSSEQKKWDMVLENMVAENQAAREQAEELKKLGLDIGKQADLFARLKVTKEQWAALPQREKFVKLFGLEARINLGQLNINTEQIVGSTIKSKVISGDRAEIVLDDGKGHNPRLVFKLEGEYWRFQLSGDQK
jgi:hypothetical protein